MRVYMSILYANKEEEEGNDDDINKLWCEKDRDNAMG